MSSVEMLGSPECHVIDGNSRKSLRFFSLDGEHSAGTIVAIDLVTSGPENDGCSRINL
jgi:hypothetical protein